MLHIYIKESTLNLGDKLVTDVEKEFEKLYITGTSIDKKLIQLIENGKYNNISSYIDRFGYKLHYEDMSTGCKAALCVANSPDKIISLIECGHNARDIIITTCRQGAILIEDNSLTISNQYGTDIEVKIDDLIFKNLDDLNKYISGQRIYF